MLRTLDESAVYHKRVEVYRNLHNDKLSVRYKGKVVGHVDAIWLRDAKFAVQPAGLVSYTHLTLPTIYSV